MKICLTCAAGGHLNQLMNIMDAFKEHDLFFITNKSETTLDLEDLAKTYYISDSPKPLEIGTIQFNYLTFALYTMYIALPCLRMLLKEKPDTIVSSGGSASLCLCYLGKLMGSKIIYLESLTRVNDLSTTGKLVYIISDLFLVQWEYLIKKYPKAKYWGKVI